jgi:nitrate reductase NapE component
MLISLMLACAILASLAFGVLAAYGVCLGFFRIIAGRARAAAMHTSIEPTPAKAEI